MSPIKYALCVILTVCLCVQGFSTNTNNPNLINPAHDGFHPPMMMPDLTCTFNILSAIMDGPTFEFGIIDVYEVAGEATSGELTVTLAKDPRLTFTYDPGMVLAGPYFVNNSNWTYDGSDPATHIWTSNTAISANGKSAIGFLFAYDPQNLDGTVTYTVNIVSGSGGDANDANNSDTESVTYFTQ